MTLGDRLKEEREALGMTQQGLAESAGVSLRSQQNYEAGLRAPDSTYLAAITATGADVLYILTGQRSQPASATVELPPRQRALLENYTHMSEEDQAALERTASALAQPERQGGMSRKTAR